MTDLQRDYVTTRRRRLALALSTLSLLLLASAGGRSSTDNSSRSSGSVAEQADPETRQGKAPAEQAARAQPRDESPGAAEVPTAPSPLGAALQGAQAYRDPVSGEFTSPPPTGGGLVPAPLISARNKSQVGLYQEVTPNGVKIHFQGRFLSAIQATRDANGNLLVTPGYPQTQSEEPSTQAEPQANKSESDS